nr:unnamed protein product [Digitaria exilis]
MAVATKALSMKLLVDRKAPRVLIAEASKDVVDFLFSLLALPIATAITLVGKDAMVGCVANLYTSVEKIDSTYVQPGTTKDALLRPTFVSTRPCSTSATATISLLGLPAPPTGQLKTFYRCSYNYASACYNYRRNLYRLHQQMTTVVEYVYVQPPRATGSGNYSYPKAKDLSAGAAIAKGFVQGVVTYTVMDNLTVTPLSTISSITLLNASAVSNLGDLEEKTVQLGYNESKTVLTDVFLGNKLLGLKGNLGQEL